MREEELEYTGKFVIDETFSTELANTDTDAYASLSQLVTEGVLTVCTEVPVTGSGCEIESITFTEDQNLILVTYTLKVTDFVTSSVNVTDIFELLVSKAEQDTLLTDKIVKASTIALGSLNQDYCDPDPCINGGTCSELSATYQCVCPPDFTGPTCNQQNLKGNFTLDKLFQADFADTDSTLFTSLRDVVKQGIEDAINASVATANADVFTMAFSSTTDGKTEVVFNVAVDPSVTDVNIVSMFNEMVARAEANTLVPGETVISSTVNLDENTQNYCVTDQASPSCLNNGVCTEQAIGFTCACATGFTGETCESILLDGSFTLDEAFDTLLNFNSTEYRTLSTAVIDGIKAECQRLITSCEVDSVVFTSEADTGLTATSFQVTFDDDTTDTLQGTLFEELVQAAEDNTLVAGHVVKANTLRLGSFVNDCSFASLNRCLNEGTCLAQDNTHVCVCAEGFVGEKCNTTAESATFSGRIRITDIECNADSAYLDNTTSEYADLNTRVKSNIERVCNAAVPNVVCTVSDITFICGSVVGDYTVDMNYPEGGNLEDIQSEIGQAMRAAANDGTLIPDQDVDVNDITFGEYDSAAEDSSGLNTGEVVAIAVSVSLFVLFVIFGGCLFLYMRQRAQRTGTRKFADEVSDSHSSHNGGFYHKRPEMLFWQGGGVARSTTSHDRLHRNYLDQVEGSLYNDRTRRSDKRLPYTEYVVGGKSRAPRVWDERRSRSGSEYDYGRRRNRYADSSPPSEAPTSERSYKYPGVNRASSFYDQYYGGTRYRDFYSQSPYTSYDHDRLQTIATAVNGTNNIDWSAMRNFNRNRHGQKWPKGENGWEWNSYY